MLIGSKTSEMQPDALRVARKPTSGTYFGLVAVVAAMASISACASGGDKDNEVVGKTESALTYPLGAATFPITLSTPHPLAIQDVTLAATTFVEVDGLGGNVNRSNSALLSSISSIGANGVQIDAAGSAGNVWAPSKALLLPGATANGNVYSSAATIDPGATVKGQVVTNATYLPYNTASWTVTFPAGTVSDLEVFGGTSVSKAPGRYGNIQIDATATLKLSTGVYYFESLDMFPLSTIQVDQTSGPVFIYVHNSLTYGGTIVPPSGGFPDVLVGYFGSAAVSLNAPFEGTYVSRTGAVTLGSFTPPHIGAFFAPTITVATGATVTYRAPANLLVVAPPSGGLQACADQIRPRDDLSGTAQAAAYQADIARYCTAPGLSLCLTTLHGRANADYTSAALQVLSQAFTPAQYLGLSRDRTRKMNEAIDSSTTATEFCNSPDTDGDWIPDANDACPNTPPLTPTDDRGCPTAIPTGPDPAQVQRLLNAQGFMMNPLCGGASPPPEVAGAALAQVGAASNGAFIIAERITSQPTGCPIWYDFQIREITPSGVPSGAIYDVAFKDTEQTPQPSPVAGIGGLPSIPLTSPVIQFNAKPGDAGTRGQLGRIPASPNRASFRVQAINGNGGHGPWSEWKMTREEDCLALGVTCVVKQ
jgi:hypothetical protein